LSFVAGVAEGTGEPHPRIRDLGVSPGVLAAGPFNAITDVAGVRVGHTTIVKGDAVRTGVTAVVPHGEGVFRHKVPAAVHVGNGHGKMAGFLQVQELGVIETPIVLTNTLSVGTAATAVIGWTLNRPGNEHVRSVNAVVGETNDGYLNDIRGMHVTGADVVAAIETARDGPVAEGCVGAGTGTVGWTVGALVQSNFGGILTIDGVRVGEKLGRYSFRRQIEGGSPGDADGSGDGSCMIVVATDAPLSTRNLERLAKRAVLGLARTGSFMSNGSGDFVIAFSTANRIPHDPPLDPRQIEELPNEAVSPLFLAAVEAVEEAVYNSLTAAATTR
jgi:D-aminopeptidase